MVGNLTHLFLESVMKLRTRPRVNPPAIPNTVNKKVFLSPDTRAGINLQTTSKWNVYIAVYPALEAILKDNNSAQQRALPL